MFLEYCGLTKHLRANGTVGRMGENVIEDSPWFTLKYCLLSWALCWQLPSLEGPIQGGSIARSDRRTSTFVLSPAHCIALRRWSTGCPWSITPLSVRTRHVLTVDILLHMYLYVYIYIYVYHLPPITGTGKLHCQYALCDLARFGRTSLFFQEITRLPDIDDATWAEVQQGGSLERSNGRRTEDQKLVTGMSSQKWS